MDSVKALFLFGKIKGHGDSITRNTDLWVAAKVEIVPGGKVIKVAFHSARKLCHVILGNT